MRRIELLDGVQQIQDAFEASAMIETFADLLNPKGKDPATVLVPMVLKALNAYSLRAQHYNSTARQLTKLFGLDDLEEPAQWTRLVVGITGNAPDYRAYIQTLQSRALIVKHYLPKIASLFDSNAASRVDALAKRFGSKQVITVVVIEEDGQHSSPERLTKILQSVDKLYEVCAELEGVAEERLSVVACDSGEDKSFDFVGASVAIERLKQLILDLWDRVIFHRTAQPTQRMEIVSKALPILEEIQALAKDKKMGREQAELLRRGVIDAAVRFMESGAIIPEIENRTQYDPRDLMKPTKKLLVSPPTQETGAPADDPGSIMGDGDRAELLKILRKSRGGNGDAAKEKTEAAAEAIRRHELAQRVGSVGRNRQGVPLHPVRIKHEQEGYVLGLQHDVFTAHRIAPGKPGTR